MKMIERGIVLVCQVVMWLSTSAIFVILCVNTILRYATGGSLQWASEVPELLFPWLVMSGVVLGAAHGAHITTSFLMEALPAAMQRLVGIGGWLLVAVLYATLTRATWNMLEIVHDEKSPILHVPGSVTYGCVMLGMAMLSLLALDAAWRVWRNGAAMAAPVPEAPGATHITT